MFYKFENFPDPEFPVYSSERLGTGELVTPHFHNAAELIKVTAGSCELYIDTNKFRLNAGDIIFIPPTAIHSLTSANPKTKISGLVFELSLVENLPHELFSKDSVAEFIFCENAKIYPDLNTAFDGAVGIYSSSSEVYRLKMLAYIYMLTAVLADFYSKKAGSRTADSKRLHSAIVYIKENYHRKILLSELSEILHVCDDHLIRLFKSELGKTPMEYIIGLRTEAAMRLLIDTDLPISQIAERCGFTNANYMSRAFRTHINMTPSEYRRNAKT
ncbi:MAG: helix-turn-helix transcriptional regulator [Clostridia bacterium]|nr:helix-turn-helix transcriptional regulator [Clostridia bacterium]